MALDLIRLKLWKRLTRDLAVSLWKEVGGDVTAGMKVKEEDAGARKRRG